VTLPHILFELSSFIKDRYRNMETAVSKSRHQNRCHCHRMYLPQLPETSTVSSSLVISEEQMENLFNIAPERDTRFVLLSVVKEDQIS
jgi:hypothetical protein